MQAVAESARACQSCDLQVRSATERGQAFEGPSYTVSFAACVAYEPLDVRAFLQPSSQRRAQMVASSQDEDIRRLFAKIAAGSAHMPGQVHLEGQDGVGASKLQRACARTILRIRTTMGGSILQSTEAQNIHPERVRRAFE